VRSRHVRSSDLWTEDANRRISDATRRQTEARQSGDFAAEKAALEKVQTIKSDPASKRGAK
jgi:hypothetical protein